MVAQVAERKMNHHMSPAGHILIFARYPVPGRVKTRLFTALGQEGAARETSKSGAVDTTVCFTGARRRNFRAWLGDDLHYASQPSGDLGTGPFTNLQSVVYWSGSEYSVDPDRAWAFLFEDGSQCPDSKDYYLANHLGFYAWAVRDGDVAPVPIPGAIWLLGSGLIGFIGIRSKFRKV
jgi:hypothetical protein